MKANIIIKYIGSDTAIAKEVIYIAVSCIHDWSNADFRRFDYPDIGTC